MKLYDFPTAPNPRRVRAFLAEKRLAIPTITIDLASHEQLTPAFRAINPRAIVPALELDDGTLITEAPVICRYLEDLHPDRPLLGRSPEERALIAMWERRMETEGLLAAAEALRNGSRRFADRALVGPRNYPQIAALAERGMARLANFFQDLNERLGQSSFVAGDAFTFADITGFIAVDFARWVKAAPPDDLTHLARWRRDLAARPCFSPVS